MKNPSRTPDLGERQSVDDGAHRLLADAEVQVATAGVLVAGRPRLDGQARLRRRAKVRRPADQPGHVARDRVQHLARRLAGREPLGSAGTPQMDPSRPLTPQHAVHLVVELGVLLAIASSFPSRHRAARRRACRCRPGSARRPRNQELRVLRPAVAPFGEADLLLAERLAVCRARILLVWGAVADVAVDDDQVGRSVGGTSRRHARASPGRWHRPPASRSSRSR